MTMKIYAGGRNMRFRLPTRLIINNLTVGILARKGSAGVTPRQARRILKNVRAEMKKCGLTDLCTVEVAVKDDVRVNISI